ncbi:polysaccharide deacetylase family protein [Planococcus sp. X10-3]|uniref:polysaccharide deacetylase family protein n=1 Tax=Planococcus sp. X10-3 TaxID=3061240 RepID=UPI003BB21B25
MGNYMKRRVQKTLNNPKLSLFTNVFSPLYSGIGSVVMFHRVVEGEKDVVLDNMEVTAAQLEKTIRYFLDNNYDIVSIERAHAILTGKVQVERKFAVFTFDDGYKDNYTIAYPIFRKYNVPFTIYVTTCFPDKTALIWWYALEELVKKSENVEFHFEGKNYQYPVLTQGEEKDASSALREFILSLDVDQQTSLFTLLFDGNSIDLRQFSNDMTMDWAEIEELSGSELVTIGAHTINHHNLRNLDVKSVRQELNDSKKEIERHIGKPVEHFAFPFGSENEVGLREFKIAEELGFKTSTTTRCGNIFPSHSQYTNCLPRITPSPALLESFPQIYASGFIPALRQKFRRVVTQ